MPLLRDAARQALGGDPIAFRASVRGAGEAGAAEHLEAAGRAPQPSGDEDHREVARIARA